MAVVGVGVDVVEVSRIQEAVKRYGDRFVDRVLTQAEKESGISDTRLAGRWAAKEAIAKASPTRLSWHDVEVLNNEQGAPFVRLTAEIPALAGLKFHLSISHERGIAAAVAILEEA